MGFINPKILIDGTVENAQARQNNPLNQFLGTPTFTKYYKQNLELSGVDATLGIPEDWIGEDSPIKFNKINDFPLYKVEQITLALENEVDSGGLKANIEFEVVILPGTIKPIPNDYFVINYLNKNYFFRVNGVDLDTIRPTHFYKLKVEFSKIVSDIPAFEKRQVVQEYETIYENIGTNFKTILSKPQKELMDEMRKTYFSLVDYFKGFFFCPVTRIFIYKDAQTGQKIYSSYLTEFIINNQLFYVPNQLDNIFIRHEGDITGRFNYLYSNTFYRAVELKDKAMMATVEQSIALKPVVKYGSILNMYKDRIFDSEFVSEDSTSKFLTLIDIELITSIQSNTTLNHVLKDIIIKYFNDGWLSKADIEALNKYRYSDSVTDYALLPLVIFVVLMNINELVK